MGFNGEDRFLVTVPLSHAYGLSMLASPAWLLGATLIFPMIGGEFEAAEEFAATILPSVPFWFEAHLARSADLPPLAPSLRLLISAGAPLRSKTALAWEKTHGRAIHVLYGSSECGGICYDRTGTAAERSRVGSPITGVQVDLDESGLISVRSAAVTTGYFPSSPKRRSSIEDGCFRTEDLGEFVDGELALLGRTSEWINVKGRKVNPREIEFILEQMPSVTDVVVLRRELPDGQGEGIRAVIACAPGSIHFPEVLAWCSSRLVSHKIPRSIAFVEQLPRTSRGKLDRAALMIMP
jgi:acyl-CoA synthetase (AMP-forming)/AMP-acid ligase II